MKKAANILYVIFVILTLGLTFLFIARDYRQITDEKRSMVQTSYLNHQNTIDQLFEDGTFEKDHEFQNALQQINHTDDSLEGLILMIPGKSVFFNHLESTNQRLVQTFGTGNIATDEESELFTFKSRTHEVYRVPVRAELQENIQSFFIYEIYSKNDILQHLQLALYPVAFLFLLTLVVIFILSRSENKEEQYDEDPLFSNLSDEPSISEGPESNSSTEDFHLPEEPESDMGNNDSFDIPGETDSLDNMDDDFDLPDDDGLQGLETLDLNASEEPMVAEEGSIDFDIPERLPEDDNFSSDLDDMNFDMPEEDDSSSNDFDIPVQETASLSDDSLDMEELNEESLDSLDFETDELDDLGDDNLEEMSFDNETEQAPEESLDLDDLDELGDDNLEEMNFDTEQTSEQSLDLDDLDELGDDNLEEMNFETEETSEQSLDLDDLDELGDDNLKEMNFETEETSEQSLDLDDLGELGDDNLEEMNFENDTELTSEETLDLDDLDNMDGLDDLTDFDETSLDEIDTEEEVYDDSVEIEDLSVEDTEPTSLNNLENDSTDEETSGLYVPATGLSKEDLFEDRLEQELNRASSNNENLSVAYIELDDSNDTARKELADKLKQQWDNPDLAFQWGEKGICLISTDNDLTPFLEDLDKIYEESGQKMRMGVSSRNSRLLSKELLIEEAQKALERSTPEKPIIGFSADPDKFRDILAQED